jgi:hypothetical protein
VLQVKNLSVIPIRGLRPWGDERQRVFNITISTKAQVLEALCSGGSSLDRAAPDEPVFILRAQDTLAPRVVVRWAHLAEQAGTGQAKVRAALEVAKQMADWQANNPHRVKVPD